MENKGFEREDSRGGCCSPGSESSSSGGGGSGGGGSSIGIVEMSEVTKLAVVAATEAEPPSPTFGPAPAPPQLAINGNGISTCSEHCQSLHLQHQKYYKQKSDPPAPESPWHHLKTIFLVGTLIFLALWVLVYTLLSQLAVF